MKKVISILLTFLLVLIGTPVLSDELIDTESFGGHLEVDYVAPPVYTELANASFGGHLEVDYVSSYEATIRNDGVDYFCWKGNNGTLSDVGSAIAGFDESTEYVAVWGYSTWNDTHACWVKYYGDGNGTDYNVYQLDVIKVLLDDSGTQTIGMSPTHNPSCDRTVELSDLGSTGNKGYNYTCYCCDISGARDNSLSGLATEIGLTTGEVIAYWNNTSYTWSAWIVGITPASWDVRVLASCPIIETKVDNDYSWVISCP